MKIILEIVREYRDIKKQGKKLREFMTADEIRSMINEYKEFMRFGAL